MNDAYTIGITLALDDEVSAGLAMIRGDLQSLNAALGEGLAGLAALRQAAGPALAAFGGVARGPARARGENATPAAPEPPEPQHPARPAPVARAVIATTLTAAPSAAPEAVPAPRAAAPRAAPEPVPSDTAREPAASVPASPAIAPPVLGTLTLSKPIAPVTQLDEVSEPAPVAGLGIADLLALTRGLQPMAPERSETFESSPQEFSAPAPLPFTAPPAPPAGASETAAPRGARGRPSAPLRGAPSAAPASPLLAGAAAAPRGALSEGGSAALQIHGDVLLDGTRVGQWFGEQLAAAANRPPAGYSGVDTRLGPLWPGAPVVP